MDRISPRLMTWERGKWPHCRFSYLVQVSRSGFVTEVTAMCTLDLDGIVTTGAASADVEIDDNLVEVLELLAIEAALDAHTPPLMATALPRRPSLYPLRGR